jgi:hypothetical protein
MNLPTNDLLLDDVRTARSHMLLSALAIVLMALALYLGHELTQRPDGPAGRECNPDTEVELCEADESCIDGTCRFSPDRARPLPCQENDPCDGSCVCDGKFACEAEVCKPIEDEVCSDAVKRVLADLQRFERERCKTTGSPVARCPPRDLHNFFMAHDNFDALLGELQYGATFHFDKGQPALGLSTNHEAYYTSELGQLRDRLLAARHILVIGRASKDSSRNQPLNYTLAQMRIVEVQRWITQLGGTPQSSDEAEKKLITLAIGTSHPLDPEVLRLREYHRVVAWDAPTSRQLRDWIRDHASLDASRKAALRRRLDQSVLVIPIPCEIPDGRTNAAMQP